MQTTIRKQAATAMLNALPKVHIAPVGGTSAVPNLKRAVFSGKGIASNTRSLVKEVSGAYKSASDLRKIRKELAKKVLTKDQIKVIQKSTADNATKNYLYEKDMRKRSIANLPQ